MQQKNIGVERGLQKIKHFCAYQERNHYEVKEKLYSFGLYKKEVETILSQLIEENFLNEERYAIAFAGGRFRIKKWGRIKIKYELKQNKLSDYCIKVALKSIDEKEYQKTLQQLFDAKMKTLCSEKNIFIKKQKVLTHLMQKGFEADLVSDLFKNDKV
ncbi:MAG: regulatory protein RecX [Ferruginibacter sp.]